MIEWWIDLNDYLAWLRQSHFPLLGLFPEYLREEDGCDEGGEG